MNPRGTMKVNVHYTTQIKAAIDLAIEEVSLAEGATLADLVDQLIRQHGQPLRQLLLTEQDTLLPSIMLCVGDEQVDFGRLEPLCDGDQITLLSAISGG